MPQPPARLANCSVPLLWLPAFLAAWLPVFPPPNLMAHFQHSSLDCDESNPGDDMTSTDTEHNLTPTITDIVEKLEVTHVKTTTCTDMVVWSDFVPRVIEGLEMLKRDVAARTPIPAPCPPAHHLLGQQVRYKKHKHSFRSWKLEKDISSHLGDVPVSFVHAVLAWLVPCAQNHLNIYGAVTIKGLCKLKMKKLKARKARCGFAPNGSVWAKRAVPQRTTLTCEADRDMRADVEFFYS